MTIRLSFAAAVLSALLFGASMARADFLNLFDPVVPPTTPPNPPGIIPGGPTGGGFNGLLGGVLVSGTVAPGAGTGIHAVMASGFGSTGFSTTDNTSPQHSYAAVYTPFTPLSDRIGYESVPAGPPISAAVHIAFSSPVLDPILHVASLDFSYLSFSMPVNAANGVVGTALLSGNGGGGDGLALTFVPGAFLVKDADQTTSDPSFPPIDHNDTVPPLMVGPRSAYGSVQIFGLVTALDFDIKNGDLAPPGIDNATFTLSTAVPEPSSMVLTSLAGLGLLGLGWYRRRKHKSAGAVPEVV